MGIFFSYDENGRIIFNELEAVDPNKAENNDTSTTDYTQDDDQDNQNQDQQPEDNNGRDNPQDAPEDYTISDDNGGEDQTPEEGDANPPEEGTEATGGDQPPEGGGDTGNSGTDYTADGGGDAGAGVDAGGGDPNGGGDGMDDGSMDDDTGGQSEDDIKALEDEIYSNYSDAQRQIMSKELKQSMNKLVTLSNDLVDRINDIPKVASHIKIIEFVSNKLSDFRDMLTDYLYYTYDTESYVKNKIAYERFIRIMKQIDELISKIPTVDGIKNKNDNAQD